MRSFFATAWVALGALVLSAGCGAGGDSSSSGGTGGTSATSTSSTTTTGTTTTPSLTCTGILNGTACAICTEKDCCDKLSECQDDPDCNACLVTPETAGCDENETYAGVLLCGQDACPKECSLITCDAPATPPSGGSCFVLGGAHECNPFTNAPCDTPGGEVCQLDQNGAYTCSPPPNDAQVCDSCDGTCALGLVCLNVGCGQICCDDGDCGDGACLQGVIPDVGICVSKPIQIPCSGGAPDGKCEPDKDVCGCADCDGTAFCVADKCTDDGKCDVNDSCTCPDCDNAAKCVCNYDGACDSFGEGCKCPDCWMEANCADNPHEKCSDDGTCAPTEFCVCTDCNQTGGCLDPNHCTEDGECAAYEGCICNDCLAEPTCP